MVYLRDEKSFKIISKAEYPPLVRNTLDRFYNNVIHNIVYWEWRFKQSTGRRFEMKNNQNYFYHDLINIIFCGKLYPCIRIKVSGIYNEVTEIHHFYDFNSYQNFLQKYELEFYNTKARNLAENFFKFSISSDDRNFLIENKITIVVIEGDKIIFNAKLAGYNFYKVFDPYTAYQELDVWLSGVLTYPQNIMIEVEDKSKVIKHGFDLKYGFRTRPGKK